MSKLDSWRLHAVAGDKETSLSSPAGFDELVVGDWFHIERMDKNVWWMRVGDARIMVSTPAKGSPTVTIERNAY